MEPRIAVVDVPELPLQLLSRRWPGRRGLPLAVVEEDRPQARLTHLDPIARRQGLTAGMRFGEARSLVPALRAAPVRDAEVNATVEDLVAALSAFSPRIEPDAERPGAFYVDPAGMGRLYGGLRSWARAVHGYLEGRGFRAAVVVGCGRLPTLAVARTRRGAHVFPSPATTRAEAHRVALAELGLSPRLRDGLSELGLTTLGDLAGLPPGELGTRFGPEAARLQAAVVGRIQPPFSPRDLPMPLRATVEVEPPDTDHARLLFAVKGALHGLLREVSGAGRAVRALRVELVLEGAPKRVERIEPAQPTRDALLLLDLVRLRLGGVTLSAPVEGIALEAEVDPLSGDQLTLFRLGRKRDLAAGARALSRVRAAFGEQAVTRARMQNAHLPEASFAWEAVARLTHPRPTPAVGTDATGDDAAPPPLVRRILSRPRPLPCRDPGRPEAGPALGSAPLCLYGPYRVSGGWWARAVERDYYYGETREGDLLWLYYDRPRGRWFQHGLVD